MKPIEFILVSALKVHCTASNEAKMKNVEFHKRFSLAILGHQNCQITIKLAHVIINASTYLQPFTMGYQDFIKIPLAMEALNAARLTPVSVFSDRRNEPKKIPSFQFKNFPNAANLSRSVEGISRNVQGGLVLLSSVFNTGLAKALTYEEALQQSTTSTSSDFDANAFVETLTDFVSDNPLVIAGGFAVLGLPFIVSQVFGKMPKPSWGVESAKKAYAKLADDVSSELVDIRATAELKQEGSPDIGAFKKKPVTIVYKGEDKTGFLNKLALKFKEPENTTLFILDK